MNRLSIRFAAIACALFTSCAVTAGAQPSDSTSAGTAPAGVAAPAPVGWSYIVEPYLYVPTMSGRVGVGGVIADVNVDAGDIISALDFGAMLYLEMHDPIWAFVFDGGYMDLGAKGTTRLGDVEIDLKQLGFMTAAYRRVSPWAEAMGGLQFNFIEGALESSGPLGLDLGNDRSWVDPHIGVRLVMPTETRWRLAFSGSIGGFGIGSSFAWQVLPEIGYRFNPGFEVAGAYRVVRIDYEEGDGNGRFVYDLLTQGPQVSAKFHF